MNKEEDQRKIFHLTSFFLAAEYVISVITMVVNRQIQNASHRKYYNIGVILSFFLTIGILIRLQQAY